MRFECIKCAYRLIIKLEDNKQDVPKYPQCFNQSWILVKLDANDDKRYDNVEDKEPQKT